MAKPKHCVIFDLNTKQYYVWTLEDSILAKIFAVLDCSKLGKKLLAFICTNWARFAIRTKSYRRVYLHED